MVSNAEPGSDAEAMVKEQAETPTIFDAAQTNIFNLMNTDSFPRYTRTEEYKALVKDSGLKADKRAALAAAGVV